MRLIKDQIDQPEISRNDNRDLFLFIRGGLEIGKGDWHGSKGSRRIIEFVRLRVLLRCNCWLRFLTTERLQNEGVLGSYSWFPKIWFQNPPNTSCQRSDIIKLIPRAPPGKMILDPLEKWGSLLVLDGILLRTLGLHLGLLMGCPLSFTFCIRTWPQTNRVTFDTRQACHLVTSTFVSRGRPGTWRHLPAFCVWRGARGTCCTWLALVARLVAVGRPGRRATLRGRRGTSWHPPSFYVAGVVLGDIYLRFAWQVWHLATSTFVWRGRRATLSHATLSNTTLSHTTFSHTSLSRTTLSPTTLSQTIFHTHLSPHATSLSHTSLSHTTLSHTHAQLFHTHTTLSQTTLSHTHTQLCHTQLFHTQLSQTQLCHPQLCHTPSFTHTQLCHTHTIFHTRLCHKQLLSHNSFAHTFVTDNLSHTALHSQSFTHKLFHSQPFTHNSLTHTFVTRNSSHTTFKMVDPPPSPLSFLLFPCRFNHFFFCLLEEVGLWGYPVL